jgi:pimeloyl-ACP methyl ester carboxylesterase
MKEIGVPKTALVGQSMGAGVALQMAVSYPQLKRFPLEMNRDDKVLAVYPPHLEEGASSCASEKRYRRVAPVSKDGAAPWFETPRTRSANLGRPKIAAPHHEAGRDHMCIPISKFARFCGTLVCELRNRRTLATY